MHSIQPPPSVLGGLCLLGAGNGNDVELPALQQGYAEVTLVDLDELALARAIRGATHELPPPRLCGGLDVTGVLDRMAAWRPESPPNDDEFRTVDTIARTRAPAIPGAPFHTIASLCVLSQIIQSVSQTLRADDSRSVALILALREQHVRLMAECLEVGGRGVLITDFVSSDTCPLLASIHPSGLGSLMRRLIDAQNFFTGANPAAILRSLQRPPLSSLVQQPVLSDPWIWHMGEKHFAVVAVTFARSV